MTFQVEEARRRVGRTKLERELQPWRHPTPRPFVRNEDPAAAWQGTHRPCVLLGLPAQPELL